MLNLLHTSASSEPILKGTTLSSPLSYGWVHTSEPPEKHIKQIIEEANTLLTAGVQELILLSRDFSHKSSWNLIELIKCILSNDQQFSLRLLYLHPEDINDELFGLMRADSRIIPYLDIFIDPTDILSARQQISSILLKMHSEMPHVTLRGSFMVDSICQTEEGFHEICQFIADMPLDSIHIMSFPALVADDRTKERFKTLSELQNTLVCKKNTTLIGTQLDVLIEGYYPESRLLMRGRHSGQCPEIDGSVIINDGRKVTAFGKKYLVEITDVSDQDLIGRVI